MPSKQAKKREKRYADATQRASGDRPALNVPDNVKLFMPKAQAYDLTILPYTITKKQKKFVSKNVGEPGDEYYERTFYTHAKVGVNGDSVVCLSKTFGKPCPICEKANEMRQSSKFDEKAVAALRPKERQLFLVFDHGDKQRGVQLWESANWNFGKQLDAKINGAKAEKREKYKTFYRTDKEGFDLRIVGGEEKGDGFTYTKFNVDDFEARKKDVAENLVEHGVNLEDIPVEPSYDQVKKLFYVTDEDSEEDEKPKKGKKAKPADDDDEDSDDDADDDSDEGDDEDLELEVGCTVEYEYRGKEWSGEVKSIDKKKGIARVEYDEDEKPHTMDVDDLTVTKAAGEDDEDDSDSDDEEDDPKPAKKGKPKKSSKDDDDDEDDDTDEDDSDDDDDEEEDEKPAKKKGGKKSKKDEDEEEEDDGDSFEDTDDEEEEDDDDDDDDDDEPPVKKGKKPAPKKGKKK